MLTDLWAPVRQARDFAVYIAHAFGIPVTLTSGYRSIEQQAQLRAQYEGCLARGSDISPSNPDARCRYPANRPGDSAHNFGLGWDSSVPEWAWPAWTQIRQAVGFTVPANDRVHAELPNWRDLVPWLVAAGLVPDPSLYADRVSTGQPGAISAPSAPTLVAATGSPVGTGTSGHSCVRYVPGYGWDYNHRC